MLIAFVGLICGTVGLLIGGMNRAAKCADCQNVRMQICRLCERQRRGEIESQNPN